MSTSIGLNIYSAYRELNNDFIGTLEKIAAMGYQNVELISANFSTGERFSDTFSTRTIKEKLDELGLNAFAAHEGVAPGQEIKDGDWDHVLKVNEELGCRSIVFPMAFIDGYDDTMRVAEQLNEVGKKCRAAGADFYYHNHAHEFKQLNGTSLFDLLVKHTDPDYVKFELDLVWVTRGGYDALAVLEQLGSRCDMIHQKDLGRQVEHPNVFDVADKAGGVMDIYKNHVKPDDFVNLGTGIVNLESVYQKVEELGTIRWAIVENEGVQGDKFESLASDLNVMKRYVQGGYINA
ncbi:sugar phosphate isomerase/epimerase [Domibacillus sp. A3M-37]|uniref:sugar phosphate isomerase/epimerase family protein n=1 Tax=Domibacillus sp. A3M-37 TaxID=2962037 RepID=UPI0020B699E8|nr:sugar phosphate isomerase/epimerase [Domibacillus sp. A3M-37]MCP3764802.1 sugar phosphate isomerase/epimerase [Domibacillus sp. A3M-37]